MKYSAVILFFVSLLCGICQGQTERDFPLDCTQPQWTMRNRGDIVRIKCDSVWVLSNLKYREFVGNATKLDSLTKLWTALDQANKQIVNLKDQIITHMDSITAIQDSAYLALSSRWASTDSVAQESIQNTKAAFKYARAIKFGSYVASGLAGGIVMGLASGTKDHPFQPGYAALGVVAGCGINYLVLEVIEKIF